MYVYDSDVMSRKLYMYIIVHYLLAAEREVDVPASDRAAADHGAVRLVRAGAVRQLPARRSDLLASRQRRRHRDEHVVFHDGGQW